MATGLGDLQYGGLDEIDQSSRYETDETDRLKA